jgi:uncharacterized protein YxjI
MPKLFALHQTLLSFSGDAWIEDDQGNRVYEVDGKIALSRTLDLLDQAGIVLYTLQQPLMSIHRSFAITRGDEPVGNVEKDLFTFLGDRFTIILADGQTLQGSGDFLDHEFRVTRGDTEVLSASRAWFSMHDTYGVRVADGFDAPLALAIAIAIEQIEAEERNATPPIA